MKQNTQSQLHANASEKEEGCHPDGTIRDLSVCVDEYCWVFLSNDWHAAESNRLKVGYFALKFS